MSGPDVLDLSLEELVDFATAEAEVDCRAAEAPPFAGVVARARELDPSLPAVPTTISVGADRPADDGVDVFISSARAEAERDSRERELVGVPALRRRSRRVLPAAGLWLVAAAVAGFLTVSGLEGTPGRDAGDDGPLAPQAVVSAEQGRPARVDRRSPPPSRVQPREEPGQAEAPAPEQDAEATPERRPVVGAKRPAADRLETLEARLARLDEEAESALRAGDQAGADGLYAEIIRIGGRRPAVELAYADRFTLAHESGDATRQRRLWKRYLRKFPAGRLADDARAGLCRQAAPADASACWESYLVDFPGGAYRSQARRQLEGDAG